MNDKVRIYRLSKDKETFGQHGVQDGPFFNACRVVQIVPVSAIKLDVETGTSTPATEAPRAQHCGATLLKTKEQATGICNRCRLGKTARGVVFADPCTQLDPA